MHLSNQRKQSPSVQTHTALLYRVSHTSNCLLKGRRRKVQGWDVVHACSSQVHGPPRQSNLEPRRGELLRLSPPSRNSSSAAKHFHPTRGTRVKARAVAPALLNGWQFKQAGLPLPCVSLAACLRALKLKKKKEEKKRLNSN